jgi:hypothetical protein
MSNPDPLLPSHPARCPTCGKNMAVLATQAARVVWRCPSDGYILEEQRRCEPYTSFDDALRAYVYDGEEV